MTTAGAYFRIYEGAEYVRTRLRNLEFFVKESRWEEALTESRSAISGLKSIQGYVVTKRNDSDAEHDGLPF